MFVTLIKDQFKKFQNKISHDKEINKVIIIIPRSVTHYINTEQRLAELELLS